MMRIFARRYVSTLQIVAALAAVAWLAACDASFLPFQKTGNPLLMPAGRAPPPVRLRVLGDAPPLKADQMRAALGSAAESRNVTITTDENRRAWTLQGDFQPQAEPDGTIKVVHDWTLRDADGRVLHRIAGAEATGGGGEGWAAVGAGTITRIADQTAESLSSRLSQLGFSSQTRGIAPPVDVHDRAGALAEMEFDMETIQGPSKDRGDVAGAAPPVAARPVATSEDDPVEGKNIRAVAVTGVKGSPGEGNGELARAMRAVLRESGWPVYAKARDDALTVTGEVALGPHRAGGQGVVLVWTVAMPDGGVLGTVKQSNTVQAGSLDKGWGHAATPVAQAAASGIFDLVKKAQN